MTPYYHKNYHSLNGDIPAHPGQFPRYWTHIHGHRSGGVRNGKRTWDEKGDDTRIDPMFSISWIIYHDLVTTFVSIFRAKLTRVCRLLIKKKKLPLLLEYLVICRSTCLHGNYKSQELYLDPLQVRLTRLMSNTD